MKTHLSDEQISRGLIGDSSADEKDHLLACAGCSSELARMEQALSAFRSTLRNVNHPQRRHSRTFPVLRWGVVAAALAIAAVIPVYKTWADRQREAQTAADRLLLEQINLQLSRSVPLAMEQLVDLLPENNSREKEEAR